MMKEIITNAQTGEVTERELTQAEIDALTPAVIVPQSVSMRQARLALHAAGLLTGIDAAITQIGGAAQIEWEYATEVRRDNQLIEMVRQANSMTVEQIDQLFISASQIE